jgi:CelD/BcsL family acetyltransferase involved in cellulose biosynthesis
MHAPLNPTVRAEWRGLADLGNAVEAWHALAARALEPNVFYEPAFSQAAAPVFGRDAGATLVWSGHRLVGLFPGRIERRGPLTRLVGWTHRFAPLGTPLVDRDEAEAAIGAWLDQLASDASMPGLVLLPLVPEQGPFAALLQAALACGGRASATFSPHRRALLAPGAERANYVARAVSTGRRKELRRQRRRLEDIAPVTFKSVTALAEIEAALKDFMALEASGWKGATGTAAVDDPAVRDFMRAAVMGLAAEGRARVDRLCLNGRTVAAAIMLTSGDTAWLWKIAYDEGLARYSPGVQLVLDCTDSLLGDGGPARVDSCATADHPMINHLWRERLGLCDRLIAVRRPALPFAITCQIENLVRAALAAAKNLRNRLRG